MEVSNICSTFVAFVGSSATHSSVRKSDKPKTETLASSQAVSGTMSPPPPLPPRSRALTTPPPPLPPREAGPQTRGSARDSSTRGVSPTVSSVSASQPTVNTVPSATPPSSLEQLAEQTGLTTQQIHDILIQHSQGQQSKRPQAPPPHFAPPPHSVPPAHSIAQMSPSYHEHYSTTAHDHRQHQHPILTQQYPASVPHHRETASPIQNGGQPPPPPNYSSPHIVNSAPPPPPYNTNHQPSPDSSVTSGSSNDYLLMNYGYLPTNTGEYRTPAYGESPSSGKCVFSCVRRYGSNPSTLR